jgi:hypothetical protein
MPLASMFEPPSLMTIILSWSLMPTHLARENELELGTRLQPYSSKRALVTARDLMFTERETLTLLHFYHLLNGCPFLIITNLDLFVLASQIRESVEPQLVLSEKQNVHH